MYSYLNWIITLELSALATGLFSVLLTLYTRTVVHERIVHNNATTFLNSITI